jgi:choline-sulfatase
VLAVAACGGGGTRSEAGRGAADGPGASPAPIRTASPSAGRRPSVLLVTIDTWRADALGLSGSGRVATPHIDALGREGLYLPRVQSSCPLTTPAHATILTGLTPARHGIRDNAHYRLKPEVATLGTLFSNAGYRTAAFVSGAPLRRSSGLDRGFGRYDDTGLLKTRGGEFHPASRPADVTTDRAIAFLSSLPPEPAFVWVHYYDPHVPYAPPARFRPRYEREPYFGEVAFVDAQIGRLLESLPRGEGRDWIVLVTGDHGEGLGEHGEETHGIALYEATIEVPLVLSPRPPELAPLRSHPGLVDVLPTLCRMAGLPAPPCDGSDLGGGGADSRRILSSETLYPAIAFGVSPVLGLRREDTIWLRHGADEVYDLAVDPGEREDLAGTSRGRVVMAELAGDLTAEFGRDPGAAISDDAREPTKEEREALASLGYAGGRTSRSQLRPMDVRRLLEDLRTIDAARARIAKGDVDGGRSQLAALVRRYPDGAMAWQELGVACLAAKDASAAKEAFLKALALDPEDPVAALNLGNLSAMSGDAPGAERYFLRSLEGEEAQGEAHLNLGLLYGRVMGRPAEAAPHFARFLELAPDDPEAAAVRALLAEGKRGARGGE